VRIVKLGRSEEMAYVLVASSAFGVAYTLSFLRVPSLDSRELVLS